MTTYHPGPGPSSPPRYLVREALATTRLKRRVFLALAHHALRAGSVLRASRALRLLSQLEG